MEKKTCNNCRFKNSNLYKSPCKFCNSGLDPKTGRRMDPTGWKQMTQAQALERNMGTNMGMRLVGDITSGYVYEDPLKPTCSIGIGIELIDKEIKNSMPPKDYNKMFTENLYFVKPRQDIKDVIFNDPATIVFWKDGTKTIVKAEGEAFDPEKGLAMAIAKKWLGNKGNYYNEFKKWLPKEDVKKETILPVKKELLLTPEQLAEKLGLTERTIQKQCRNGLHPGAKKIGGKWSIPYVED